MAGPWEAYQQPAAAPATEGPWAKYAQPITDLPAVTSRPDFGGVSARTSTTYVGQPQDVTEEMSGVDKFRAGMGKAFSDTYAGLKQAGTEALGNLATDSTGLTSGQNAITRFADQSLKGQQAAIDESRRVDQNLMDTGAGLAGNVSGYAAQVLLPAGALRGTVAAGSLLPTTVAGNAAQGAVLGGLQPTATGETRAGNAGIGAAFGAGGAALAKGIGALASSAKGAVSDQARAVYQAAKDRGIELSPAQISDSRFLKWSQSILRSVPFTGAAGRFERQVGDFNRALAKTIGEDAPSITSEVYQAAKQRQSQLFDDLTARNAMKVDDSLVRSLTNIAESAKVGGQALKDQVEGAVDALYAQATTGPGGVVVPGPAYQAFDSQLNQIIKNGGPSAHFLGNVQKAVRRAMDNSINAEDAQAWKALRTEYGNRKTLTPLVAAANDGLISPARVQGAVTATKSGKESMASGTRGELGELAAIGQRMKEPPSSGTAERGLVGGLLGGGAMIDPFTGGLSALGLNVLSRGLDSTKLAQLIMRQNPGVTRAAAAEIIRRSAVPAGETYNAQNQLGAMPSNVVPVNQLNRMRGP